jgi:hypothetical protein
MGDMFKSKTEKHTPEVSVVADPYAGVRNSLQDWLVGQMGKKGETYGGEFVAPMSDAEKQSQTFLNKYTQTPIPSIWSDATSELSKTLKGDYDPATSPYYQAVKAEAARNLDETQKNIASNAAGGGRYYTGARVKQQGEAATDMGNTLNTMLGKMAEEERVRRLQAAPVAMQAGQYEQALPLQQATALQQLGSLPRTLNQAYLDAVRGEWEKSTRDWPLSIAGLAAGVQQAPMYAQAGYTQSPSMFSQIWNPLAGGVGQGLGTAAGMGMGNYFFPSAAKATG